MKKFQYRAIHTAVVAVWGKPNKCESCEGKNKSRRFEWSNKDHKYSLLRRMWWILCSTCHRRYDRRKFGHKTWNKGRKGLQKNHNMSGLLKTPWNKGKKTGLVPKSAFKKGNKPWNLKGIVKP